MPDPSWTAEYNTAQSPESNGFTRQLVNSPIVTEVTSGNPSDRRVEIGSDDGDAIFLTSSIPSLDPTVGVTAEALVSCSGAGDAGFELTFLDAAVLLMVYENSVEVSWPSDGTIPSSGVQVPTDTNTEALIRYLFKSDSTVEVYRDSELIIGPVSVSRPSKPFQRVLWWGEGGGTQTFKAFRYWIGGAMAPG